MSTREHAPVTRRPGLRRAVARPGGEFGAGRARPLRSDSVLAVWGGVGRKGNAGIRAARIGVVVDAFDASYQATLVHFLATACRERRLELVVFPGGIMGSTQRAAPLRNAIYEWITPDGPVDGLVLLGSTIVREIARVQRWCERLRPLPVCSIGLELEGVPSILPDNHSGVRAMVQHLVAEHGLRRLAFVSGPAGNQEARERLAAFRTELTSLGLKGDEAPCVEGDFLAPSGREAAHQLLAQHPDAIEGILAANDYMAMGVLDVLRARPSPRERRIAVTGFDNVDEAAFTVPPLTTVQQPLRKLAESAISSILGQLEGEAGEPVLRLPTQRWIRRSCGCKERAEVRLAHAPARANPEPFELFMKRHAARIGADLERISEGSFVGIRGWDGQLIEALVDQLRGVPGDLYLSVVDRMLLVLVEQHAEVWRFQAVLTALRAAALDALRADMRKSLDGEELFHTARSMTSAAAMRAQAHAHAKTEVAQRFLNETATLLSACSDVPALRAALDDALTGFGLRHAFLMTFVQPEEHGPPRARLFYGLGLDPDSVESSASCDPHELLPAAVWERTRRESFISNWVVLPLFSRSTVFGFAVLELNGQSGSDYETFRIHLSTALAGVLEPMNPPLQSISPATQRSVSH